VTGSSTPRSSQHLDGDRRPLGAAQHLNGLVVAPPLCVLAVDLDHPVAHAHAGALGRGAGKDAHRGDVVVARGDLDADAGVLAAGLHVQLGVLVGRHEARVGVAQLAQHPLDGLLVQLGRGLRIDVARLHVADDLVEELRALVDAGLAPDSLLQEPAAGHECDAGHQRGGDDGTVELHSASDGAIPGNPGEPAPRLVLSL